MARKRSESKTKRTLSSAALKRRLKNIRLLSLDVDGVLTDGGLYYGNDGNVTRKFHVLDGVGIKRVLASGIVVAFVSAGSTRSINHRARTLGIRHVLTGVTDKRTEVQKLCRKLGLSLRDVAHMGDDLNDVPLLKAAALALTVPAAAPEVLAVAHHVTRRHGGEGAVREICDLFR